MFRNHYDHDVSIWSPQGRIHQIEYAMEAVKQGSAAISLKSNDYAVIVALKRSPSELSSYQEKILTVDDHVGVAMAGLTTDGRLLCRAMRRECANNKWSFDEPLPITRLMYRMSLKMHPPTQRYGHRPFGAGLLVCGYDKQGPHVYYLVSTCITLFQCPSANSYDYKCAAIGARSQSARTYLERHFEEFKTSDLNDLVVHGLLALQTTLPNEVEINNKAYITSSQLYNWKFAEVDLIEKRQVANTKAAKRLIDLNQDAEEKFPVLTTEDELSLVKRFYLNHSVMDYFPRELMLTCLYLACKCADFPISLQHFVSHIPRNQDRYSEFIVNSELFLIDSLNYDLFVHTPHRAFMGLVIDLVSHSRQLKPDDQEGHLEKEEACKLVNELKLEGYELIQKWFQTDICLTLQPSEFALGVLVHLGKDRPSLDVEAFVRDEICGCDPIKPTETKSEADDDYDDYDDDYDTKEVEETPKVKPIDRWNKIRRVLDSIEELVSDFDFVVGIGAASPEEMALEKCRNPLYNPECEEYRSAKEKAESLMFQDL